MYFCTATYRQTTGQRNSKMKRNISNISKESTAKSEVKPKNEPWGGMFCCAGGRGGDKA